MLTTLTGCDDQITKLRHYKSLQKYYSISERSLEALENDYLWFSVIENFNDPFEGQYTFTFNPSFKDYVTRLHWSFANFPEDYEEFPGGVLELYRRYANDRARLEEEFRKEAEDVYHQNVNRHPYGYLCLCGEAATPPSSNHQILMWSHYAAGLKGLKVVFDIPKLMTSLCEENVVHAEDMEYSEYPTSVDLLSFWEMQFNPAAPRWNNFTYLHRDKCKHSAWSYESEVRLCAEHEGKRKYSRSDIMRIEIGEKMSSENKQKIMSIFSDCNIEFLTARLKPRTFEFEVVPGVDLN